MISGEVVLISIPGFVINIVIFLYTYWYYCECIRDSSEGGLRAPGVLVNSPTLGDMFFQLLKIIGCFLFFGAPMLIYFKYTGECDVVFWSLCGCACFFFPMGLLPEESPSIL